MTSTTPKLRFPGLTDGWQLKSLSDVIESVSSGVSVNSEDRPAEANEFGILKTSAVFKGKFYPKENKAIVPAEIKRAKLKPVRDSIIVSRMNTPQLVGESGYVDADYDSLYIPDRLWQLAISQNHNAKWLSYVLASDRCKYLITSISSGTSNSMKNISQTDFLALPIRVPSEGEQKELAEFLAVVDEKIANLEQKAEKLKAYKRGVMQKLFTQKIHFKDEAGDAYAEWEERSLFEIADRVTERNKGNKVKGVLTNSAVQGIVKQNTFFDKDIAKQGNLTNYHIVSTDDFVYNPRISAYAPVGPIKRNHLSTGVMSPLYSVFRLKEGDLSFFEYYFETEYWHEYMRSIANSGARHDRMNITTSHLYELPLPYPCQEEQAKIANFLSAVDEKIELTRATLEKTKEFKKSLLQRMFV